MTPRCQGSRTTVCFGMFGDVTGGVVVAPPWWWWWVPYMCLAGVVAPACCFAGSGGAVGLA